MQQFIYYEKISIIMKSLVIYFSRTDITKKLAEEIASKIDADTEQIISKVKYDGKIGYMKAGKDAISEKIIEIEPVKYDPHDYDIIYLGTPVWAGKSATPLISYIKENEGKFSNVKFFATAGASGFESTFKQLENATSQKPQKTLALTTKDVKKDLYKDKLADFIE